LVELENMGFEL